MPKPVALELAARSVAALYQATAGRAGRFRGIADVARRAGISDGAEVELAWKTAEAADRIVVGSFGNADREGPAGGAAGDERRSKRPFEEGCSCGDGLLVLRSINHRGRPASEGYRQCGSRD